MKPGVKYELVVTDEDGWNIYHLSDKSGYTHRYDTVRVGRYNLAGDYRVERWTSVGWQHLLAGRVKGEDSIEWVSEGVNRAVKVMYR